MHLPPGRSSSGALRQQRTWPTAFTATTSWVYISRDRAEAVRACRADSSDDRTILDIAYAVGFTSKSTFNAAFKRQVGQTPSVYRGQLDGKSVTGSSRR
jgi:AraC-like DNA-binding protein